MFLCVALFLPFSVCYVCLSVCLCESVRLPAASVAVVMRWVASVCLYVYVCVCVSLSCSCSHVSKSRPTIFTFGVRVHLQNIYVNFICQGHRVNVKVT